MHFIFVMDPTCSGYLCFSVNHLFRKTWKRRYFQLDHDEISLFVEEEQAPKHAEIKMIIKDALRWPSVNYGLILYGTHGQVWKVYVEHDAQDIFACLARRLPQCQLLLQEEKGWLQVAESGGGVWKNRFVVLHGRQLAIYDMNLEGRDARVTSVLADIETKHQRKNGMMFILTNGSKIRVIAETSSMVTSWKHALRRP